MRARFTRFLVLFCLLSLIVFFAPAQSLTWKWFEGLLPTTKNDAISIIKTDSAGNIYISGTFQDSIRFNNTVLLDSSHSSASYILKYDASHNFKWAHNYKEAGGMGNVVFSNMDVTPNGNCYLSGQAQGPSGFKAIQIDSFTLNFPDGGTTYPLLVKLDNSGKCAWVKSWPTKIQGYVHDVKLDAAENAYVGGLMYVDSIGVNHNSAFMGAYDKAGNQLWLNRYSYFYSTSKGACSCFRFLYLALDGKGNLYGVGNNSNSSGSGSTGIIGNDTIPPGSDFMCRFKLNGTVKKTVLSKPGRIACFNGSDLAIINGFTDSALIGTTMYYTNGGGDIAVRYYDTSLVNYGGFSIGGKYTDGGISLREDPYGNLVLAGYFKDTINYDNQTFIPFDSASTTDMFLCAIDPSNNNKLKWKYTFGGNKNEYIDALYVDPSANIFFTGSTGSDSCNFGVFTAHKTGGPSNIFFSEIQYPGIATQLDHPVQPILYLYPNPVSDLLVIRTQALKKGSSLRITDILGGTIMVKDAKGIYNTFYVGDLPKGIYLLSICTAEGIVTKKFVKL